jgi:hypothetical protein
VSTPVEASEQGVPRPVRDPRVIGLDEWEAIQTLCDSLLEAGGKSVVPAPPPITPNSRL